MESIIGITWDVSGTIYYSQFTNYIIIPPDEDPKPVLPLIKNISPLSTCIDIFSKGLRSNEVRIIFDDSYGHFFNKMSTEKMKGDRVFIRSDFGQRVLFLKDRFIDRQNKTFIIVASDRYQELYSPYLDVITREQFPNAHIDAYGKAIKLLFGVVDSINTGTFIAYRTDTGGATPNSYLLCSKEYGGTVTSLDSVYKASTNTIAIGASLVTVGDLQYIDYAGAAEDYLKVNVTSSYTSPADMIYYIIESWKLGFITPGVADLKTMLNYMNCNIGQFVFDNVNYTGEQLLQILCKNLGIDWWFVGNALMGGLSKLVFSFFDLNNKPTPTVSINPADVQRFEFHDEDEYIKNIITGEYAFKNTDSKFRQSIQIKNDAYLSDSIDTYGISQFTEEFFIFNDKISVYNMLKYKAILRDRPILIVNVRLPINPNTQYTNTDLQPYKFIYMTHPMAITTGQRLYKIISNKIDYKNDVIDIEMQDVEYLNSDLDTDTKLLLNSNTFDGAEEVWNSAAGGFMQFTNNVTYVKHSTTQKKFGDSSLRFDGTAYLEEDTNTDATSNADYNLGNTSLTDSFTVDGFVRFDNLGASEMIWTYYEDINNLIQLRKLTTDRIQFLIKIGNVAVLQVLSTTILSNNTWYHICVIRDGSNVGFYLDGVQEQYTLNGNSYTVAGVNTLGRQGLGRYFTGYLDSFRITHGNPYAAVPNVGLTDTITVPVNPISWYNSNGE